MQRFRHWMENEYHSGMCDAFAIALSRLYGWRLAVIRGFFMEDGEEYSEDSHAVAILPNRRLADIDGIHDFAAVKRKCFWNQTPHRIKLVPVTEDEMSELFTVEGLSEADIQQAIDYIKTNWKFSS